MEKHTYSNQYGRLIITGMQCAMLCFTLTAIKSTVAQEQIIPFTHPGDERPDVLEDKPFEPKPQPKLQLPPIKKPDTDDKQLSQTLQIDIKQIQFQGNTAFSSEQLTNVVKDYIGKTVNTLELQQIRLAISQHYVNNGYINSGAIIPDQDVAQGILQINIIEGQLTEVIVSNKGRLNDAYISDRIRLDPHQPLSLTQLQERLYLLQQDPRIKRINADLGPGSTHGEGILNIAITEEKPYNLALNINNHRPPSVGEEQAILAFNHLNVSGLGDDINLHYSITEGLDNSRINYNIPVSPSDTKLNFTYETTDSEIIEESFKALGTDFENESYTGSIGATYPLYKSSKEEYTVAISIDKRRSESAVITSGVRSSFSGPGAESGVSRVSAFRLTQSWLHYKHNEVFSFRHKLSIGMSAFGSTNHSDENIPDSRFTAWLLQFQWAKRFLPSNIQTIFRSDLQLAHDDLLPMEEFAVGGANTVRGYRENQLVRDNGFIATWEVRKPVYKSKSGLQEVQLLGFTDFGRAWHQNDDDAKSIYSAGAGIRWTWKKIAAAEVFWAKALEDLDNPDEALQDNGLHINIVANLL